MPADPGRLRALTARLAARRVHLRWSELFGVVTVACLLVLAVTGVLLATWYTPSNDLVAYDGPYGPLQGATVTEAFASTMRISFEVTGGLLLRQTHHWAALVLPASMIMQLLVTFFTGGFRRPRRVSWVLLVGAFVLALLAGWSGYALPDDMLSGTGLRIVEGVVLSIPFIGTWLTGLMFGGPFPGQIIENLYPVHAVVAPVLLALVLVARAALAVRHGQAEQPPSLRATLGMRLWPDAALRAAGMTGITTAVLVLLGATSTISPVWSYGPASGGEVGAGSQPDWYMGFLDGALRLVPVGWETEWAGWTVTFATLVPLAVVGGYFVLLVVYPWLEAWIDQDRLPHDVLDRPRNVPARTGIGVAGALFYGILWGAASADIVATEFSVSFEAIITTLQVALVVGPPLAFEVTRRICVGLQRKDREVLLHGHETGRIVRLPNGGYVEVHQPASGVERARLGVEAAPTGQAARAGVARAGVARAGVARDGVAPDGSSDGVSSDGVSSGGVAPGGVGPSRDASVREVPGSLSEAPRSRRAGRVTARDRVRGSLGRGFGLGHVVPRTTTEEQTEPQPTDGPAKPDGAARLDGAPRSDRPAEPHRSATPAPPAPAGPPDRRTSTEAAGRDVA